MLSPGHRSLRTMFRVAACLFLAAGTGCGMNWPWVHSETGPSLEQVKVSDLRPGEYCEIDMFVSPMAPEGSFHRFKGTVREVSRDDAGREEVVLVNAMEGNWTDYGSPTLRPQFSQQKRELVRVPMSGVDAIWALSPGTTRGTGCPGVAAKPSAVNLPAHVAQPPLPESPAHFDAPSTR